MKKTLSKKFYNLAISIFILIFLICSVTAIITINDKYTVHAYENQKILADDFDFSDSSVLVTMNKDVGGVNKIHKKNFFGDIAIKEITDLTYRENGANVDLNSFSQTLKLELKYNDKNYVLEVVEKISKLKGVESVAPNYIGEFCATANDSSYNNQWGLNGTNGINVEPAWDITTGSKKVRVGVIDTGITQHTDLNANLTIGRGFLNDSTEDKHGHGTHIAGIIGAVGDNNLGISGVCKNIELVPLKISNFRYNWYESEIIKAINYADDLWGTANQIDLLNFSGAGFSRSTELFNAFKTFRGLIVCSAGNDGIDIDNNINYPASYKLDNVIAVGAFDSNGKRSVFSNYGKNTVDIFAPGVDILSTFPQSLCTGEYVTTLKGTYLACECEWINEQRVHNSTHQANGYHLMSGTSMATPFVTGVAALMLSYNPNLTAAQLKAAILDTVDKNSSLSKLCVSGGRLNAYKALLKAVEMVQPVWEVKTVIVVGDYQRFYDEFKVTYGPSTQYKVPDVDGQSFDSWRLRGTNYDTLATGTGKTINVSYSILVSNYPSGGRIYLDLYYKESSCVVEGTLITLADGSRKAVEDLTGDEMLLVWNLETGTYDVAPILFIDSEPTGHYEVIKLSFSDGTTVDVISEHGFWDVDLNKYVYLDKYASGYIGHSFLKQGENGMAEVTLVNVDITAEVTTAYSPVTYGHLCYYVNGMLSMPGGIEGLFNIFEVDNETMMYDAEAMATDIEEYGLFTYEEFYAMYPIPERIFESFNGGYLKVAVGKGLITYEQIGKLIERYSNFF